MKPRLSHLPIWLGVVTGLLAGYVLGQGKARPGSTAADGLASRGTPASAHSGSATESPPASKSSGSNRRFLIPKDKLTALRNAYHSLVLDMKSFRQGPNAETDATFELLHEILDLTPDEEKQLRDLFTQCANELATAEQKHSSVVKESDQRLVLHLTPLGQQGQELCDRINQGTLGILGEERSALLNALSHPDSIVRSRPQWADIGEISFQLEGPKPTDIEWVSIKAGNTRRLVSVNGKTTEYLPVAQLRETVFEGYEHLIDEETRTKFIKQFADPE
ncbi:MAG: hypothetical protein QM755_08870 [Luteolibacter sp.]